MNTWEEVMSKYREYILADGKDTELLKEMEAGILEDIKALTLWKIASIMKKNRMELADVQQTAALDVLINLRADRMKREINPSFLKRAFRIYYNKAVDSVRLSVKHSKELSIDAADPETGFSLIDRISDEKEDMSEIWSEIEAPDWERNEAVIGILKLYLGKTVSGDFAPHNSLALLYARILSHIHFLPQDSLDENKDNNISAKYGRTASKAGWAYSMMKGKTFETLSVEGQSMLQKGIDESLCWGEEHWDKLHKSAAKSNDNIPLGDIVYTDYYIDASGNKRYSQKDIEKFAE